MSLSDRERQMLQEYMRMVEDQRRQAQEYVKELMRLQTENGKLQVEVQKLRRSPLLTAYNTLSEVRMVEAAAAEGSGARLVPGCRPGDIVTADGRVNPTDPEVGLDDFLGEDIVPYVSSSYWEKK